MKKIYLESHAIGELQKFDEEVQLEFEAHIKVLEQQGKLEHPHAKKVSKNLFEIRVRVHGAYRGFYAYIGNEDIIILHFFRKKTQKTPEKHLKVAKRRLRYYET